MKESSFQFTNPVLVDFRFKINSSFNTELDPIIEQNFNTDISVGDDESSAIVSLTINIGGEGNRPFELDITYVSHFKWSLDLEKEQYDQLLKVNAPSLLLSYMRPIIYTITSASPLPTYNLPFMDFTENENS